MLGRLAWLLQNVITKSPLSYLRVRILPIVMYLIAKEKDDHKRLSQSISNHYHASRQQMHYALLLNKIYDSNEGNNNVIIA